MRPKKKIACRVERLERRIFHLILVSASRREIRQKKTGLRVEACAVVAIFGSEREVAKLRGWHGIRSVWILRAECARIRRKKALHGIRDQFAIVRFCTA